MHFWSGYREAHFPRKDTFGASSCSPCTIWVSWAACADPSLPLIDAPARSARGQRGGPSPLKGGEGGELTLATYACPTSQL